MCSFGSTSLLLLIVAACCSRHFLTTWLNCLNDCKDLRTFPLYTIATHWCCYSFNVQRSGKVHFFLLLLPPTHFFIFIKFFLLIFLTFDNRNNEQTCTSSLWYEVCHSPLITGRVRIWILFSLHKMSSSSLLLSHKCVCIQPAILYVYIYTIQYP